MGRPGSRPIDEDHPERDRRTRRRGPLRVLPDLDPELFRALVEDSSDAVFVDDLSGRPLYVNRTACAMYGYTREELMGHEARRAFAPEGADGRKRLLGERLTREGAVSYEAEHVRKDGTRFPVQVRARLIEFGGETVVFGLARDTTAEHDACRSQSLLASIVECSSDAIIGLGLDAVVTSWNAGANAVFGYRADEMIGRNVSVLAPGDLASDIPPLLERLRRGERVDHHETERVRKDGSPVHVSVNLSPLRDEAGEVVGGAVVARDVTEHRRVQEELRRAFAELEDRVAERTCELGESEERYRTLVEQSPDAVFVVVDGRIGFANDAAARLLGVDEPGRLEGTAGLEFLDPAALPALSEHFKRMLATGLPVPVTETVVVRDDGTRIHAELSAAMIVSNGTRGFQVVVRDVTERKNTERELGRVNRALRTLSACNHALVRAESENGLLGEVCRLLVDLGGYRLAWVGFGEHDADRSVRIAMSAGPASGYLDGIDISWGEGPNGDGPAGRTIRSGRRCVVRSTVDDERFLPWRDRVEVFGLSSMVSLPLVVSGEVGALCVYSERSDAFDDEEIGLLMELAEDLAFGLASLRERDERRIAERALEESARQWHLTFDSINDMVALLDTEGHIVRCNEAHAAFIRQVPEAVVGKRCPDLMCRGQVCADECALLPAMRTGERVSHEAEIDGRWLHIVVDPVLDSEGHAIGMVHTASDITAQKRAESELGHTLGRLEQAMADIVRAIARIVETRDPYTAGHQERVALLARAIAEKMGFDEERIQPLHLAALIHDIGKIYTPAEILAKPGKLSPIEFELIKTHPAQGFDILKGIDFPWPIAETVLQHHERLDGSGYPAGLTGDAICLDARILAVADVVEAVASHRPYRPALGVEAAIDIMSDGRGTQFDAVVVDACVQVLAEGYEL